LDLTPDGFFSFLTHLLADETSHHLEDSSEFSFSLEYQVALSYLVFLVTITDILDIEVRSTFLLEAASEMGEEVIALQVKEPSTTQFVLDRHVVIFCLLLENRTALLTHFSSRSADT
jgi:hypothetical protein